ncbi:hypothetical protein Clacol_002409 [Clathrus columnatus]|uniref:Uncharacterized protein n=1 Tax=Clathrus columnatus TaxID=1419009 RepID=A0AAV5A5C0_9AGAM|nr:hypothetical protein Clacol_002409 [Clathrus columnatus]
MEQDTKEQTIMLEKAIEISSSDGDSIQEVDPKALLRKMDYRFLPWLISLIEPPLEMPKCVDLRVPSNVVLKKLRPSIWIPICMTCWVCNGVVVQTLQGIVQNYGGLVGD